MKVHIVFQKTEDQGDELVVDVNKKKFMSLS